MTGADEGIRCQLRRLNDDGSVTVVMEAVLPEGAPYRFPPVPSAPGNYAIVWEPTEEADSVNGGSKR